MALTKVVENLIYSMPMLRDAILSGNARVLGSLLGPAWRGFIMQEAKRDQVSSFRASHDVTMDWGYERQHPEMRRLYEIAKTSQWNATTDIDWAQEINPGPGGAWLLPDRFLPIVELPQFKSLPEHRQTDQRLSLLAWMLSQFLHGEQGALAAAAQVTEAVPWLDAKLYGSTQVVDEGRHVEVFHRYLDSKLSKLYEINDNLYVVIDALMLTEAWDMKFLGMQIMIEGLALGAFVTIRGATREPLLRELLKYVIMDEARHVHFGVMSLGQLWGDGGLTEYERRYREDWALQVSVQLRNRFLAHEFYDEYYGHMMSRREWDRLVLDSPLMGFFRQTMFKRIMPNLRRLGLLSERVQHHYRELGLLDLQHGKAAPDISGADLVAESAA